MVPNPYKTIQLDSCYLCIRHLMSGYTKCCFTYMQIQLIAYTVYHLLRYCILLIAILHTAYRIYCISLIACTVHISLIAYTVYHLLHILYIAYCIYCILLISYTVYHLSPILYITYRDTVYRLSHIQWANKV